MKQHNHLPRGWVWTTVEELGAVDEQPVLTGPFGTSLGREDFTTDGVPLLTIGCLTDHGIALDKALFVSEKKAAVLARYRLRTGDLLFSRMASVGRAGVVGNALAGVLINYHIMRLRLAPTVVLPGYFIAYVRGAGQVPDYIREVNHGATRDGINTEQLLAMPVALAPLPEQHRIVAEIEKHFTRLDAAVAALERVRANLKRYRATVLKAACEGRLVPTEAALARAERRDYEPADQLLARILKERRARWEADQLARMQARGKLPKDEKWKATYEEPEGPDANALPRSQGWAWATIDQVAQNHDGQRVPVRAAERVQRSGPYPYYGASGIIDHVNDYLFDGEFLLIAEDGANLLSRSTPIAFRAAGKFWVNNHAHVVRSFAKAALGFIETFLNALDISQYVTGSAQPKLTQAALNKIPLPLPPLAEQHRIVAEVERRLSVIDELDAVVDANLKRAERLRQAILKRAFEGKLVPQDPSDEPASVLLERIRAERDAAAAASQRPSRKRAVRGRGRKRASQAGSRAS